MKKPNYKLYDKKGGVYGKSAIHGEIEYYQVVTDLRQKRKADGIIPLKSVRVGGK